MVLVVVAIVMAALVVVVAMFFILLLAVVAVHLFVLWSDVACLRGVNPVIFGIRWRAIRSLHAGFQVLVHLLA